MEKKWPESPGTIVPKRVPTIIPKTVPKDFPAMLSSFSPLFADTLIDDFSLEEDESAHPELPLSQEDLKQYMRVHSLKGALPMAKDRQPFIGEIVPFTSPTDEEVTFGLRRLDNRAVMQYRDANSAVRYIMEEGNDNRVITEKDYPMGSMRRDVVKLGLATWNITDAGKPVAIDEDSILAYLDPINGELDAVYEKIMEINPILTGNGNERKKS